MSKQYTSEHIADMRETLIVFGPHSESYYLILKPEEVAREYERMMERGK